MHKADNSIDGGMGSRPRPLALPAVGTDIQQIDGRLALVASDVTTETKVVFPEDTDLYYSVSSCPICCSVLYMYLHQPTSRASSKCQSVSCIPLLHPAHECSSCHCRD